MSYVSRIIEDMQELAKTTPAVPAMLPAAGSQGTHFWKAQDAFLKEFESFASAWFKRRHEGTLTAMQTTKQLTEEAMGNPGMAMTILAEWQTHSMERLAEDVQDYVEMVRNCAAAALNNEVEAVEEGVETAKRASKTPKSEPV